MIRVISSAIVRRPSLATSQLNVLLLLQREPFVPSSIGVPRPDDAYAHPRGMITKRDVRLVTMDRLKIAEDDLVWDVGAGSGALSIEIGERAWRGQVFAIEKNAEALINGFLCAIFTLALYLSFSAACPVNTVAPSLFSRFSTSF